ncbi:VCBS repeat-containing protein [Splendidivirga corallicola]
MRTKFLLAVFYIIFTTGSFSVAQKKLFELIPSSKTNVTFNNQLVDTKEHNILIYSNYYGGAGVGVGDFNNDGLQDLFFAGNLVADELYLNKGNFQFENITESAGIKDNGGWSSGVVVGDVNNDGWLDIYVTRELYDDDPELRRNKLYINNGDLTFSELSAPYKVDHDGRTRHAVFFDYNQDGWLDLFLLTQPPNPGNYSPMYGTNLGLYKYAPQLLRNTGKGYFENVSKGSGLDVPGFPNSVSANDFNNDGWVDLYLANDFKAPDKLYLNKGNGTFENVLNESSGHITYFSMGVDAADINNDGFIDVNVLDMSAEKNDRIKANMSGMNPKAFWNIVRQGGHYQYMYNTLQLNNGIIGSEELSFSDIAQISGVASTDWSWSNLIADFDNDGKKDIYITNGLLRDIRNTDSDKDFAKYVTRIADEFVRNNPNAGDVSIWDILDLEEALEIIPTNPLSNYAYRNNTGLSFSNATADWGLEYKSFSNGSAFVDLNNDGTLDLVVNNVNEEAFIFRNNAREINKNNYIRISLNSDSPILGCKISVSTNGEKQWYEFSSVRGMYSCSEQIAHFGLGGSSEVEELTVYWNDGNVTKLQNLDVNQHLIVSKQNSKPQQLKSLVHQKNFKKIDTRDLGLVFHHEENDFDDYTKQVLLPHKMSQFGPALAVDDVNGDDRDDIYIGGATDQKPGLFFQNEDGTFTADQSDLWRKEAMYEDIDAVFFDFDLDGDKDLYVVSGGNKYPSGSEAYQDRLYKNNGQGGFERLKEALPKFNESGACVRSYDFDGDGDLDLFVGGRHVPWSYPEPTTSRLLLNEKGNFKDITKKVARNLIDIGMVTDAIWTDFDQDGLTDILLVGEWMPVTFMRFTGESFYNATNEFGLDQTSGWWSSIEEGDTDQDGDIDYVIGNLGLNYKYKATRDEPFEVYYKDFDNSGQKDIVLSYYNFGEKYPLRGRSCSAQQVPMIGERFETYNSFASANLYDVYGLSELNKALNYKANIFAHVHLENLGKGKFEIEQLPEYAQISSINDLIIHDFSGNGKEDILAVGNNFPVEIETPRNDAGKGVFLINNGNDYDTPLPSESGFFAPKNAKKLSFIVVKNSLMVIIANNNDHLELFEIVDLDHNVN